MELVFQRADLLERPQSLSIAARAAAGARAGQCIGVGDGPESGAVATLPGDSDAAQVFGDRGGQRADAARIPAGPAVFRERHVHRIAQRIERPSCTEAERWVNPCPETGGYVAGH